jgi:protocatechuate 3,4-dioxygenase, alpha subunit
MALVPTASQTVGPFFRFGLERPELRDLTRDGAEGAKIRIEGKVLAGDGQPVKEALLEIWQANAAGRYAHPEDTQDKPIDSRFLGFGRCCTEDDGSYYFVTIRPGQVPGRGNALQAPHIALTVFARGMLKREVTRIYFADEMKANEIDPLLSRIEDVRVRETLLARPQSGPGKQGEMPVYRFDIRLQGEGETAFFDI